MKIDSSKILKEGAVLKVEKIDFNDPVIKKLVDNCKEKQKQILSYRKYNRRVAEQI